MKKVIKKMGKIAVCCETLNIFYRIINNNSDESIVVIPGHSDSSYSFQKTMQEMNNINQSYNYISFDLGWGKSDISRERYTKQFQIQIINSFLENVVLQYSDKIHLAGHSMGGELALIKGVEEDKKRLTNKQYNSIIKSITAICPSTYPRTLKQLEDMDFYHHLPKPFRKILIKFMVSPEYIRNKINKRILPFSNRPISKEDGVELYKALEKDNGVERFLDVQKAMHFIKGSEYIAEFKRIQTPLQFIFGKEDKKIVKKAYKYFQKDFPGHPIKVYDNCGHFIQHQCPEKLAKDIIDFVEVN